MITVLVPRPDNDGTKGMPPGSAAERHADDRSAEEVLVAVVGGVEAVLEPQPEGEEVSKGDQYAIGKQLRERVTVDGEGRGSDPSAHAAVSLLSAPPAGR